MSNFIQSYWGASSLEQLTGSKMVLDPDRKDVTAPGVTYTCIATKTDQLINPPSSCFLNDGSSGKVNNFYVQDRHPGLVVLHEHMTTEKHVRALVLEALDEL